MLNLVKNEKMLKMVEAEKRELFLEALNGRQVCLSFSGAVITDVYIESMAVEETEGLITFIDETDNAETVFKKADITEIKTDLLMQYMYIRLGAIEVRINAI